MGARVNFFCGRFVGASDFFVADMGARVKKRICFGARQPVPNCCRPSPHVVTDAKQKSEFKQMSRFARCQTPIVCFERMHSWTGSGNFLGDFAVFRQTLTLRSVNP